MTTVQHSFSTGAVTQSGGTQFLGGMIGRVEGSTITNLHWYDANGGTAPNNCYTSGASPGIDSDTDCTAEITLSDFYSDTHSAFNGASAWNFTTIWNALSGVALPTLR